MGPGHCAPVVSGTPGMAGMSKTESRWRLPASLTTTRTLATTLGGEADCPADRYGGSWGMSQRPSVCCWTGRGVQPSPKHAWTRLGVEAIFSSIGAAFPIAGHTRDLSTANHTSPPIAATRIVAATKISRGFMASSLRLGAPPGTGHGAGNWPRRRELSFGRCGLLGQANDEVDCGGQDDGAEQVGQQTVFQGLKPDPMVAQVGV